MMTMQVGRQRRGADRGMVRTRACVHVYTRGTYDGLLPACK